MRRLSSLAGDSTAAAEHKSAERRLGADSFAAGSRLWSDGSRGLPTRHTLRKGKHPQGQRSAARIPRGGADHVSPRDLAGRSSEEAVQAGMSRSAHRRLQEDKSSPADSLPYAVATMSVGGFISCDAFEVCPLIETIQTCKLHPKFTGYL